MSQKDEPLRDRIEAVEEKVECYEGQLGELASKLDRIERMLLFLIERATHRHVDGWLASDEREEIRALLRGTSTTAVWKADFNDERRTRSMEFAFDHIYERLEEYGLPGVGRELRGE